MEVNGGSNLYSHHGYVGHEAGATGLVLVKGASSTWTNSARLVVGNFGRGTLNITSDAVVNSDASYIGYESNSTGTVMIDGASSTWTNSGRLVVGNFGHGMLSITGGATVSSAAGFIGCNTGSTGTVTIDGAGSTWNSGPLFIDYLGQGTLSVTGGGFVTASSVSLNDKSLLAIDVGCESLLNIGWEGIVNDGTVRVFSGAGADAGNVYSPIAAGTWSGSGVYQAIGGTWDGSTHQFTVSTVQSGSSGSAVTINLHDTQRLSVVDAATGWAVGASFLAADESVTLNVTATAIDGTTLTSLQTLLGDQSLLGGWTFELTGDGYAEGDPAYLSFDVGAGFSRSDLNLWHYDETEGWTEYAASDLTYDGQYASFTVTGFSGYAVSAVPEPGTLALLIAAVVCCLFVSRRRLKSRRTA